MFKLKNRFMGEGDEGGEKGGGEGPTVEQLQEQLTSLQKEKESIKAKNDELLGETKKAKEAKRQVEEAARIEAEEKAKAAGDHEQLYKSAMSELEKEREERQKLVSSIANEKRNNAAMKISAELADGTNAELLSEFIVKRLKFADGEIKVTDNSGELTISTMDDLKNEIKSDTRFVALLKGNQSSGGGATGGKDGSGAAKTKTRAEFEALTQTDRMKFTKEGGRVT